MILRSSRVFIPPADVIELDDKIVVVVEIAGIQAAIATSQCTTGD
jgi:HSP20 family molecular chaperone IbpA